MPIRQPLQTPDSAEDSTNKSFRFMVTPDPIAQQGDSGDLSLTTPLAKPVLTVSHSELTFAKTTPGHPKFLVLTISQQHTNTPVTLTTDTPDHFQLACDSHPSYAPSLTLVPSATGTYVHIRYEANSLGTHQGQLFIEAPYDNGVLPLKGSSLGILPTLSKQATVSHTRGLSGILWAGLLIGLGGLAVSGYYFRYDLFPGLYSEEVTNQPVLEGNRPLPAPTSPKKDIETMPEQPTAVRKEDKKPTSSSRTGPVGFEEQANRTPFHNASDHQGAIISTDGAVNKRDRNRTAAKQETNPRSDTRSQRPAVTNSAEAESELEQELNQKPPRQQ